jgi:hypothetical protein
MNAHFMPKQSFMDDGNKMRELALLRPEISQERISKQMGIYPAL